MTRPPADDPPWYSEDEAVDQRYRDAGYQPDDDYDSSLADDVLSGDTGEYEAQHAGPRQGRGRRSPAVRWAAIVGALAIVVIAGIVGLQTVGSVLPSFDFGSDAPEDFEGSGSGEVVVDIPEGAGGGEIGRILVEEGVVASAEAFSSAAAADPRSTGIQPGTYTLASQMSAGAALDRLLDPSARQVTGVTVREGLWKEEVYALLAEATGHDVADYEEVDPEALGLPEAAGGDPEGYLFPDTYAFGPATTPEEQLRAMVDLGQQRHEALGIEDDELERTIIVASLVQAEAAFSEDLPKVARVVENRLADDEPLGFDSTIHFMFKERGRAGTTDEQRATESPYNTYLNAGLPPGPINSPGAAAIEAAQNPAEGDWKYFVTVDPDTGETVFADTYEEHLENQQQFQQWCRDNPDRC